jgi:anti-sigma factor ChrR (cupin superfamily)
LFALHRERRANVTRFAKRAICPSSEILEAYRDGALAPALARTVAEHVGECDFCDAESHLLGVAARAQADAAPDAPPMPLALRLFAESQLAEVALSASLSRLRAA